MMEEKQNVAKCLKMVTLQTSTLIQIGLLQGKPTGPSVQAASWKHQKCLVRPFVPDLRATRQSTLNVKSLTISHARISNIGSLSALILNI